MEVGDPNLSKTGGGGVVRRGRMGKGYEKEEGLALPTSVALANRQMSLSLTEVNHVSWGVGGRKGGNRQGRDWECGAGFGCECVSK